MSGRHRKRGAMLSLRCAVTSCIRTGRRASVHKMRPWSSAGAVAFMVFCFFLLETKNARRGQPVAYAQAEGDPAASGSPSAWAYANTSARCADGARAGREPCIRARSAKRESHRRRE